MSEKNTNSEKTISDFAYEFIPEKPKLHSKDDPLLFGHKEIVDTLKSIILHSPKENSLTIGLFGDWGSGKSTIAGSLQQELSKGQEPLPVVIFDVWKHEGDALRRTFLKHLEKVLRDDGIEGVKYLPAKFEIQERIEKSTIEKSETQKFNWGSFLKIIAVIFFLAIVPALIFWLIREYWWNGMTFTMKNLEAFLPILAAVIPVSYVLEKIIEYSTNKKQIEFRQEPFRDPIDFMREFRRLLEEVKSNKLIVVFDNLDRVSGEKAIEVISTIKTFLEPIDEEVSNKEAVFIIPCDDRAIQKHLVKVFTIEKGDPQEFIRYSTEYLRKFFNTVLRIPSFNITELEDFAWTLLQRTTIPDFQNKPLSSLITGVFRENPRQIVQFINTLIANYVLLREREINDKGIEAGFLSNNTLQLAKYLLLIQKFPSIMDVYKEASIFDLNYYDKETILRDDQDILEKKEIALKQKEFNEFRSFLDMTEHIHIASLEIFFKFRITDHERAFPNSSRLIELIEKNSIKRLLTISETEEDKDAKEIKEYIRSLSIDEHIGDFGSVVKLKLDEKRSNPTEVCKFLNGLFYLTKYDQFSLSDDSYADIAGRLNNTFVLHQLNYIDPKILSEEFILKYNGITNKSKKQIVDQWSEIAADQIIDE